MKIKIKWETCFAGLKCYLFKKCGVKILSKLNEIFCPSAYLKKYFLFLVFSKPPVFGDIVLVPKLKVGILKI